MRLLIYTQKVDHKDSVLGFFHRWIIEIAKHTEKVIVVCLYEGEHDLPSNVRVYSLGKESGSSRFGYIFRFYALLWQLRGQYDGVLVHMNQVYVILGSFVWRLSGIPIALWYAHRARTFSLWLAEKFVNAVFTNSNASFTVPTKKAKYVGHGIDAKAIVRPASFGEARGKYSIISVGRITLDKDQETIIRACGVLLRENVPVICTFVGSPTAPGDEKYFQKLQALVRSEHLEHTIVFKGGLPQAEVFPYYWRSNIHINACERGSLDKVILEATAAGAIPVVANEAFIDTLGGYADRLIFERHNPESLAKQLKNLLESNDQEVVRETLSKKVIDNFDLSVLITQIISWYETSR